MSEQMTKYVQFEISNYEDRQNLIRALANAGYKVWCHETKDLLTTHYYVRVEEK